jgi:hypothetical protein
MHEASDGERGSISSSHDCPAGGFPLLHVVRFYPENNTSLARDVILAKARIQRRRRPRRRWFLLTVGRNCAVVWILASARMTSARR